MRTACGYVRVSSEDQADSGLGLEAQRQRIRAYCELKGLHLAEIFEDPGISGGKALRSRPTGIKLLGIARKSEPVIVFARFDRLFRSVADAPPRRSSISIGWASSWSRSPRAST
jgi:DNA invertase Pin-like site-specific DNA recombinase